jgi:hypothetical protein
VLLVLYSVGLAIPFVLLALVFADPLPLASLRRNVPLPPRVARAIDTAVGERLHGPVLLSRSGQRLDRPETPPESCAGWPAGPGSSSWPTSHRSEARGEPELAMTLHGGPTSASLTMCGSGLRPTATTSFAVVE